MRHAHLSRRRRVVELLVRESVGQKLHLTGDGKCRT